MLLSLAEILEQNAVVRDHVMIHPLIRPQIERLCARLEKIDFKGPRLEVFETWRSPTRQAYLTTKKPRVTEVQPWQSAHQYGLAVDFVGRTKGGEWVWDLPSSTWRVLRAQAQEVGLAVPAPSWDPGHVEYELWQDMRDIFIS